jgi:hypothetical protein
MASFSTGPLRTVETGANFGMRPGGSVLLVKVCPAIGRTGLHVIVE